MRKTHAGILLCIALLLACTNLLMTVASASGQTRSSSSSGSASGQTSVSIKLPDCIILHYYAGLTINFEQFSSPVDEGSADFDVQWSGEAKNGNSLSEENIGVSLPNTVSLELPNVWAIRGLSPSGNAKVSISVTKNLLISGPSRITIEKGSGNIEIKDNAGNTGTMINTTLNGITPSEATMGNVRMTLDFSETTRAGLHTGGQYKITAETI